MRQPPETGFLNTSPEPHFIEGAWPERCTFSECSAGTKAPTVPRAPRKPRTPQYVDFLRYLIRKARATATASKK